MADLSVDDVKKIIVSAKVAGADSVSAAMQIFSALGEAATVSGSILREALSGSAVTVEGPLAVLVNAIENVTKSGNRVAVVSSEDSQISLSGTTVRFKKEVSFDVVEEDGLPVLKNITGAAVHKVFWLGIQALQLKQNQGQKVVRVVTSGGTRDIAVG